MNRPHPDPLPLERERGQNPHPDPLPLEREREGGTATTTLSRQCRERVAAGRVRAWTIASALPR